MPREKGSPKGAGNRSPEASKRKRELKKRGPKGPIERVTSSPGFNHPEGCECDYCQGRKRGSDYHAEGCECGFCVKGQNPSIDKRNPDGGNSPSVSTRIPRDVKAFYDANGKGDLIKRLLAEEMTRGTNSLEETIWGIIHQIGSIMKASSPLVREYLEAAQDDLSSAANAAKEGQ